MKKLQVERTPDILVFELKAVTGYDPAYGERVLCVEKKVLTVIWRGRLWWSCLTDSENAFLILPFYLLVIESPQLDKWLSAEDYVSQVPLQLAMTRWWTRRWMELMSFTGLLKGAISVLYFSSSRQAGKWWQLEWPWKSLVKDREVLHQPWTADLVKEYNF